MAAVAVVSSITGSNAAIKQENKRLKDKASSVGFRQGEVDATADFNVGLLYAQAGNARGMSKYHSIKVASEALKTKRGIQASAAVAGTSGNSTTATLTQSSYNAAVAEQSNQNSLMTAMSKLNAQAGSIELTRRQQTDRVTFGDVGGGESDDMAKHAISGIQGYLSGLSK